MYLTSTGRSSHSTGIVEPSGANLEMLDTGLGLVGLASVDAPLPSTQRTFLDFWNAIGLPSNVPSRSCSTCRDTAGSSFEEGLLGDDEEVQVSDLLLKGPLLTAGGGDRDLVRSVAGGPETSFDASPRSGARVTILVSVFTTVDELLTVLSNCDDDGLDDDGNG